MSLSTLPLCPCIERAGIWSSASPWFFHLIVICSNSFLHPPPPLNLRTSTLSSFHGGSPFLTNWTLGRNFRSNGQHQCNKSSHPVTTGHFLKPRVILKIWILCWLPSLLPIIQANSCGFLYHWWNISIVRMSSEWPLIPAFLKWTLIEARNKWIHQRAWSVLVDRPTRWSLWYGYLDFYVDTQMTWEIKYSIVLDRCVILLVDVGMRLEQNTKFHDIDWFSFDFQKHKTHNDF